ncbi:MAG TPA: CPBP family intramembrane metalloprotease [Cyclobacteriaceae bacterium]|nr:CPBP family intramembrane metalloprotease [Cyclobacteriaceae bacterium]HMV08850.1 CPBP family intramembrane metalloprotease [Cyclobacteriaceae bacterium]HMW99996.1 CPBP family intramembrane metalloprotease [Cyclobacteriaceae bacterium]HMX49141.1 CPBP family intramembrane metalloprotease [Cyclobacteriaceae bacterium]HMY92817.1 CPBP family intramembrane metalloprotease [Cyclobacteriaceae bacterium]
MPFSTQKNRKLEILAVLLTAAGKFIFMDFLKWKLVFIIASTLGWAGYVYIRNRKEPGILAHWGFRLDNFNKVLRMVLPFGLLAVLSFFVTGYFLGTINMSWHIIPILLFYPIWGVIQQFLVIGLMAGNLQDLQNHSLSRPTIILLTALLFGLVHYPYYWLMAGTFILALFYGFIYLKERNVYVMGLFHGWLGGLFFYTVVNRDPFAEVFGKLFN